MNCKNNESFQYSGKEMSPLGTGYCADAENLGKEMVGKDGNLWVVRAPKGIKLWARVTEENKKLVREPPMLFSSDNDDSDVEDPFGWKPTQEEVAEQTPSPMTKEVKVPDAPKKRGRPSKAKTPTPSDSEGENDTKVVVEQTQVKVPDAPKKRGRPSKAKVQENNDTEDKPKKERKPRAKKNVEGGEEKKERKPRAKTAYNEFLSMKMKELREAHKEESIKTTEYMKMAIAAWKEHKAQLVTVVA